MFDFNCDVAQSYGVFKFDKEYEIAKYASSINISSGFHAGDPMKIREALLFASNNNISIGAHIAYPDIQGFGKRKMDLLPEELEALVIYQVGAIVNYAKTFDLEVENVRCHGALKDEINQNPEAAKIVAGAIIKISPWLNLFVNNPEIKNIVNETGLKAALEVDFNENSSIRQIRELEFQPDTIHFRTLEDIKRAYDIIKPVPVNYNRVQNHI